MPPNTNQPANPDAPRETLQRPGAVSVRLRLQAVAPFLGRFRPLVGQSCHQCTAASLGGKLLQNAPALGFQNLLCVTEMQTRYRGWLVRRLCGVLFVWSCEAPCGSATDRRRRLGQRVLADVLRVAHPVTEHVGRILSVASACISPSVLRCVCWLALKMFGWMFCSVQVNLSQMAALHSATKLEVPLVYVCVHQSWVDQLLIALVLFCHNLRVPYTISHTQTTHTWLRAVLQKVGVILLPAGATTEKDAETDALYSPIMTSLLRELLGGGESVCVSVCGQTGQGSVWLARVRQVMLDGCVPDLNLVPVGISYDCPPLQPPQADWLAALRFVVSLLSGDQSGSVRIHFAQALSLRELCNSGMLGADGGRPLQDLLLPAVLHSRPDSIFGQRDMSWLLPSIYAPEIPQSERQQTITMTQHLLYSTSACMAVMSTSLVSCLLLHKHRKGVGVTQLCRDFAWLLEEVLFRNRDVGFSGSLIGVVYHALSLLRPCLVLAAPPPQKDPVVATRPTPTALLMLSGHAQPLTHLYIQEAVGACAVSALLREVAACGGAEMEVDVALSQDELTNRALQLTHLLPAGFVPPCQSAHSFALDAVDSLVRCGILIMEEVPRESPLCDYWRRQEALHWNDPEHSSDSDCEEQKPHSYRVSRPSACPDLLFFLCSLLEAQLRALCWALEGLHLLPTPLPEPDCADQLQAYLRSRARLAKAHYESSESGLVRTVVQTLTDLGVFTEAKQRGCVHLSVGAEFQQAGSTHTLHHFISQFLYD